MVSHSSAPVFSDAYARQDRLFHKFTNCYREVYVKCVPTSSKQPFKSYSTDDEHFKLEDRFPNYQFPRPEVRGKDNNEEKN